MELEHPPPKLVGSMHTTSTQIHGITSSSALPILLSTTLDNSMLLVIILYDYLLLITILYNSRLFSTTLMELGPPINQDYNGSNH
jgi:hypothetical protein